MKTNFHWYASLGLCLLAGSLEAQTPRLQFPSPSPGCTLKQHVGLTDIEISYSRPGVKGRQIFGGLVPYGEVWRTGANGSTKISFSTPVKLNGNEIPAGKYALYTIPGESEWTIIISKNTSLNGAFGYDAKDDLVRFKAEPTSLSEHLESFTIDFTDIRDDSAMLYLAWENTLVPMRLEMDVVSTLTPRIEAAMAEPGDNKPYYPAAMFYYDHGQDLQQARKWIDAAAAKNETYYILHLKAKILAKLGDKDGAIAAAKRSSELAVKAEGPKSGYVKMNQELIANLQ
ncbi:MAG TPA: DUF2911 domain-containing protein [Verrucomicrobiae bacterium]|nr:DUF2911 domain-containing protein [Verrucomicrobiae bacterium]